MADQKISQLTAYTTPIATDIVPIVDVTAGGTKKIAISDLKTAMSGGAITPTTVNGLTVGLGTSSLASNIAVGVSALAGVNSGAGDNTAVGYWALKANTSGARNVAIGEYTLVANVGGKHNVAVGTSSLQTNISNDENTAIGYQALYNSIADKNTSVGSNSLFINSTGAGNVAIGYNAGYYETGSNAFYVDNQNRTNTAGDKAKALLYGTFDATAINQILKVNGVFFPIQAVTTNQPTYVKGGIYFDTTLNKLCVGGASGWETITSVAQ